MLKSKKIMIVLVTVMVFILVGMFGLEVNATDNPINLNITGIGEDTPNDNEANEILANQIIQNQIIANQIAENQQAGSLNISQSTTGTSDENKLPKTGVTEDITVMAFIIVCAISSIYAYKKIREYNG